MCTDKFTDYDLRKVINENLEKNINSCISQIDSPESGWDNLTHLLPKVPRIDIRENENEE